MTASKLPVLVASLAVAAGLATGCAGAHRRPPPQSPAEAALPVGNPTAHGTPLGLVQPGIERVAVKLGVRPDGGIQVLDFLSPDLTESERAELRDAIERGELRPETGPARNESTWTTFVVRRR